MLVTSLMPDSRAAMVDEGGVCAVRRGQASARVTGWRAASACGRRCGGRRGTVDIVACVASRGAAEVATGAPAAPGGWGVQPPFAARGSASDAQASGSAERQDGRLGAVGGGSKAWRPPVLVATAAQAEPPHARPQLK